MDGVAVGSLYALIALGYTMVYGTLQFINFAHSDIFVLGAWISYTMAVGFGYAVAGASPPLYAGVLILFAAMAFCGAAGFAGVQMHLVDVIGAGTALALMVVLDWLIFRTRLGRAMRAVSHDTSVAALMGINVDAVISFTFILGSSLAAAAGFLYAMKYPGLNQPAHATWVLLGLKAFVAAVIGGIGNIRGAMLGGVLIGFIELFGAAYLSPHLRDIYVFSILILVLLVRPTGILGTAFAEKV
jgi:branched-chain amino acid transport system permease protein